MRFFISRTSIWSDTEKPHKDAFRDNYIRVETRTVNDPSKLNHKSDRDNWYNKGTNHRVENGKIKRDFQDEDWFIEISSLEDLIEFKQDMDEEIVITNSTWNKELLEIEIYDSYRE